MKSFRILICGTGAAGERHLSNLLALGQRQVALLRRRGRPLRSVTEPIPEFSDWELAYAAFQPEVVIVANPTALHLETALTAARAGCHVFIEKPVSHTMARLAELANELKTHARQGMIGYMLRFHPLLQKVKAWIEEGENGLLGRPLYAHACWAEHVPDWHPWEDYAESYAVRADLGGGAALTYSHDLDLCLWLFGPPQTALGCPGFGAPLAGDAESGFDLLLRYPGGFNAHVHADYFTRPPVRRWELTATRGRVVFDYYAGTLLRYDGLVGERPSPHGAREPAVETLRVPDGFSRNDMFRTELSYFIDCLAQGRPARPDIQEGARVLQLALAARTVGVFDLPADPYAMFG